ncbi:MAG: hypothetical protein HC902_11615 [Calothrix sp. SM1_5_4]|nr:hypothetical protein [Calothrix sp. SM1_5_4]
MKPLTVSELNNVVSSLAPLLGTRLQEVQTTDSDVVLGFYTAEGLLWLWLDMNAARPSLLPWVELPSRQKSKKTPLHLFLRAHFADRVLRSLSMSPDEGRVVRFRFGEEGGPELEARIFPHGRNIIARADGKQISWQKPKPLGEATAGLAGGIGSVPVRPPRDLDRLREEWLEARRLKGGAKGSGDVKVRLQADLAKKRKAYDKVFEELRRKRDMPWKQVGDWLKQINRWMFRKNGSPLSTVGASCLGTSRSVTRGLVISRESFSALSSGLRFLKRRSSGCADSWSSPRVFCPWSPSVLLHARLRISMFRGGRCV